ncbi:MAG TPA: hypothetical protein VFH95_04490 [Candidatus Kapabacteria bacterium]|nr:hypothetical protein [Candidatus Kapabacteria bacterium]
MTLKEKLWDSVTFLTFIGLHKWRLSSKTGDLKYEKLDAFSEADRSCFLRFAYLIHGSKFKGSGMAPCSTFRSRHDDVLLYELDWN